MTSMPSICRADPLDLNNTGVAHFPGEKGKTTVIIRIARLWSSRVWSSSCQCQAVGLHLKCQAVKVCFSSFSSTSSCQGQAVVCVFVNIKLSRSSCWFTSSVKRSRSAFHRVVNIKLSMPSRWFTSSESSRQGCPSQAAKVVRVKPPRLSESSRQGCPKFEMIEIVVQGAKFFDDNG